LTSSFVQQKQYLPGATDNKVRITIEGIRAISRRARPTPPSKAPTRRTYQLLEEEEVTHGMRLKSLV
jgi:hypothetical protein